ncbi:MAG: MG2 domain-containing protein [Myxococcota bacterium]
MNRLIPLSALIALCTLARAEIPELADTPVSTRPAGPPDTRRDPFPADARALMADLELSYAQHPRWRSHVQLDRPLYRPGDTVQLRAWTLDHRFGSTTAGAAVQLVDPRGVVVSTTYASGPGALQLPADAAGGTWTVRLTSPDGTTVDRTFAVANFQAPRVEKTLEFARDGYGPGDEVSATIRVERATGEPVADADLALRVRIAGQAQPDMTLHTDGSGVAPIRFTLPADLGSPDVLVTVSVDDGGVTESITRSVPVVLDKVGLAFFPEGGDWVAGLPARLYFEGTDAHGAPADLRGTIRDDRGATVGSFDASVDGRGVVELTPEAGRRYSAHVPRSSGVDAVFALPEVRRRGCVLRHHDDLEGVQQAVRVGVTCTESRQLVVVAAQHEQVLDRAAFSVAAGVQKTVHLRSGDPALSGAQGVARVTVFDRDLQPMAERLVFRNKSRALAVSVTPDRQGYAPGDSVTLSVETRDPDGRPVPAELALAVVDDAVMSFADDDQHDLRAAVLLQADLPEPIRDVAPLFEPDNADGALGLDLALGTRGWRRFDWDSVRGLTAQWEEQQREANRWDRQMLVPMGYADADAAAQRGARDESLRGPPPPARPSAAPAPAPAKAPSRVFAPPPAGAPVDAPAQDEDVKDVELRDDFRDTVAWLPSLRTDASGAATTTFQLSDAVTGFRVVAEGVGGGAVGRGEATLSSTLPFAVDVRVPQALSTGDQLWLPITLEDRRAGSPVQLGVEASLLTVGDWPRALDLGAGERRTVYARLTVPPGRGTAEVRVAAIAGDRRDGVEHHIPIQPRGFPLQRTFSGVVEGVVSHAVSIGAPIEGSVTGRLTVFPSSVAELTEGIEQMVRTPGGCFEQTSSTNYPNVVILDLLDRSGRGDAVKDREAVLRAGYDRLAGYQVSSGGFETFGSGPGKEALSAFGLLEFTDMAKVFPVGERLLRDNVAYLYQQRDGKGGYAITGASAHGYGTAPPEVLDAYITYALVETGHTDLPEEIAAQSAMAQRSRDPYRLALATMTLLATRPAEGKAAAARLASLQASDGSFPGSETSITRSENQNLLVEATALSTLALLRAGDRAAASRAVRWFHQNQSGAGVWGATQGNALALKAIAAASEAEAAAAGTSRVEVTVDGAVVASTEVDLGGHDPVSLELPLGPGDHTIRVRMDRGSIPYALDVGWSSESPASDPDRRVELTTHLDDDALTLGDTARLTATLRNATREVVPDPIARIGLPAGLEPAAWQLEQLKDRGEIAFFETRPREVTLYWQGLGVGEVHEIALDLVATVPGTFTGPASAAYPYYDDQAKAWAPGLPVSITP